MNAKLNPALLEWVIENLVKNAVDAMEGSGKITVRVHPFEDESDGLMFRIMEKVFQLTNSKQYLNQDILQRLRGWGLGLSLAKRIMWRIFTTEK
jgi:signal transduction histidine kinase